MQEGGGVSPAGENPTGPGSADRAQLEALVTEHLPAMRSYVQLRLGKELRTRENVSDIVQSAVREILAHPGRFAYQGEDAFRRFLARVIDNKIKNKARTRVAIKRSGGGEELVSSFEHLSVASDGKTPSQLAITTEELERLREAIDELDEEDRRLLSLSMTLQISMAEIARDLGQPETTVRSRMRRIMGHLAFSLGVRSSGER